jgi:hypothetical protein
LTDSLGSTIRIQRFGARGPVGAINQIVIIESLRAGDRKTGRLLRDDLEPMILPYGRNLQLHYKTAASAAEFDFLLRDLWAFVNIDHRAPCLQIECHGGPEGLEFADGSIMTWRDLKPLLMAINYAARMNLFLVMSCCYGGYFAAECRYHELVPFAWMLGPADTVKPTPLYSLMTNFWSAALKVRDVTEALTSASAAVPGIPYASFSAVGIFRLALAKRIWTRIGDGVSDLRGEEPMFDRLRMKFFGLEEFPENAGRFSVTYAEVLDQVKGAGGKSVAEGEI